MSGSVSLAATINFGVSRVVLLIVLFPEIPLSLRINLWRGKRLRSERQLQSGYMSPHSKSGSAHFQLFSQNPMQPDEQSQRGHDQNHGVESKHAKFDSEITFLQAEEHVRLAAAAIIVLLHL